MSGPHLCIIPAAAVFDERLSATDLRVLAALGVHADRNGHCNPSLGYLAKRLKTDRRHVRRRIRKLEDLGILSTARNFSQSGQEVALQISINLPVGPKRPHPSGSNGPTPGAETALGGRAISSQGVGLKQPHHKRHKNDKGKRTESAFEEFWETYLSRGDYPNPKKPAREKFLAAVKKGTDPADILRGVKNFVLAEQANGTEPRFIPMAITWLNQERWEDYQAAPSIGHKESDPQPRSMNAI
ncbi:MAG: helix-turn-helix domain-containing protein [Proteobacteria bacterium]|nr:helix-turn-helix domain-containing protein [Pseudomonadota bacterium]